jgi:hypothetical protein
MTLRYFEGGMHELSRIQRWWLMPPFPKILLNAAAPQTDAPAAVLVTKNVETSLPRRASERP